MGFYKRYSCIGLFAVIFTHAYTTFGQTTSTCFLGGIGLSGSVAADVYNRSTGATATYTITSYTIAGTCPSVTWSFRLNGLDTEVAIYTFATSAVTYNPSYTNLNVSATSAGVADQSVVTLKINQLSSNESGIIVFAVNAITSSARTPPLEILDCNPINDSSLITSASSSPCGYQCQVEYSCASNYFGDNVSAVCLADATLSQKPICVPIVCSNSALCSTPRYCYNKTGSTNAGITVTTQCNTGYSGSVSAACGNDGSWTITAQSPCPALCPVSDIKSSPGRCTTATGDVLEGQNITVTCCNGYEGVSTMAVCTSDRSWSNLPTCTKTKGPTPSTLSTGAIIGIVIGCLVAAALITFVLIAIFCTEICCCTFSILCLSWGTKN